MLNRLTEIGSEFWLESVPEPLIIERDGVYCLSGRTAIDLILQEIMRNKDIKSVAMPSWCCDSMLAPFIDRGVDVKFYEYDLLDVPFFTDVLYLTNYFGYENTLPVEVVTRIKERGSIILYDRTHSFLMGDAEYRDLADYSFASIRKWMGVISGAEVEGVGGSNLEECPYAQIREKAMRDKYRFLNGDNSVQKDEFLSLYKAFASQLATDYRNYSMDDLSYSLYKQTDLQAMLEKRRENSAYIHKNLKGLQFLFEFTDGAVPLFVPVLFNTKAQRDEVRHKLIEQYRIYCPVHWQLPSLIPSYSKVNDIVSRELSLLCDQRYSLMEIQHEIETIMQLI